MSTGLFSEDLPTKSTKGKFFSSCLPLYVEITGEDFLNNFLIIFS